MVIPPLEKYLLWDREADPQHYKHLQEIGASVVVFVDVHSMQVIRPKLPVDASGKTSSKILDNHDTPLIDGQYALVPETLQKF